LINSIHAPNLGWHLDKKHRNFRDYLKHSRYNAVFTIESGQGGLQPIYLLIDSELDDHSPHLIEITGFLRNRALT
jgi:hypothetical protein